MIYDWQLQTPMQTIVFDCDGTLSVLEGIDELANKNGVGPEVQSLTAIAMGQTGITPELYQHRLRLVQPTREQVEAQGLAYFENKVPDVDRVIHLFQRLQKTIYIISAGLSPAVAIFGDLLGVPRTNIFAVPIEFDDNGAFKTYDQTSPLVRPDGKRTLVEAIKKQHPAGMAYVGDGLNDYAVYHNVNRFVGYGGIFYHEKLASKCQYYIQARSMSALLPLTLVPTEVETLTLAERELYDQGLKSILNGEVIIRPEPC